MLLLESGSKKRWNEVNVSVIINGGTFVVEIKVPVSFYKSFYGWCSDRFDEVLLSRALEKYSP